MVYLWKMPKEHPEELMGRYIREQSPDRSLFLKGAPVPVEIPPANISFDAPIEQVAGFDILPNSAMIPLVSQEVAALLGQMCPTDVQFIETNVTACGRSLSGYKLLNALHLLNCVDREASECVYIPKTKAIMKFNRLRLKPKCLGDHHIGRELDYLPYLYVSEGVKEAFDSKRWHGYLFLSPESVYR